MSAIFSSLKGGDKMGNVMHPFVVIEGLGGTGKTTVGKILAKKVGGIYIKTPTESFATARKEVDASATPMARFLFYLATVVQASVDISHIIQTVPVVCDKYILSTICWHRAMGIDVRIPEFVSIMIPNFTFLLTCPDPKRIERLEYRDKSKLLDKSLENAYTQECQRYSPIIIDNANDDPMIAVMTMLKIIGG